MKRLDLAMGKSNRRKAVASGWPADVGSSQWGIPGIQWENPTRFCWCIDINSHDIYCPDRRLGHFRSPYSNISMIFHGVSRKIPATFQILLVLHGFTQQLIPFPVHQLSQKPMHPASNKLFNRSTKRRRAWNLSAQRPCETL